MRFTGGGKRQLLAIQEPGWVGQVYTCQTQILKMYQTPEDIRKVKER